MPLSTIILNVCSALGLYPESLRPRRACQCRAKDCDKPVCQRRRQRRFEALMRIAVVAREHGYSVSEIAGAIGRSRENVRESYVKWCERWGHGAQ